MWNIFLNAKKNIITIKCYENIIKNIGFSLFKYKISISILFRISQSMFLRNYVIYSILFLFTSHFELIVYFVT